MSPPFNLFRSGLPASAVGTANARLGQLWLDALAAERGAAARTLQTYRDDLAMAALQLTAGTSLERFCQDSRQTARLARDRHKIVWCFTVNSHLRLRSAPS